MAKKEAPKKEEAKPDAKDAGDAKQKKVKPKKSGAPLFMILSVAMAAIFLPSSVLLAMGMMPTFAALFSTPSRARTKALTVGALNLAGCVPFLLQLWTHGHSIDKAFEIITDPMAIIVMYAAAAIGYLIDWSMSAIVASILYQRGVARLTAISKRQEELANRWGQEVTGLIPLDNHGFAVKPGETTKKAQ